MRRNAAEPVVQLLKICHEALKPTRGAAISLASFDAITSSLAWLGVGNVEAVILGRFGDATRVRQSIMLFPGVVGHRLPPLQASVARVEPQDLLVFFTDGINRSFLSAPMTVSSPQGVAAGICRKYSKGTDDALVLVSRFRRTPQV